MEMNEWRKRGDGDLRTHLFYQSVINKQFFNVYRILDLWNV